MNGYYPQNQNYGPQHNGYGYAPMQQPMQQMPMAAPVVQSTAASKGLLMVAGIAVVGAAAFGGVYLMNSSSQPEQTAASQPSTVLNIPSEINIPGLNTNSDPASPVIVNNPAPVRVVTQPAPRSNGNTSAPVQQAPVTVPVEQKPVEQKPVEEPKKEEPKEEPKKEEPAPAPPAGGGFPDDLIDYGGCACGNK